MFAYLSLVPPRSGDCSWKFDLQIYYENKDWLGESLTAEEVFLSGTPSRRLL